MTAIVGISRNATVYMGGDSCASDARSCLQVTTPKVFITGRFLIGGCGSFRMIDLLRFSLRVERQSSGQTDDSYIRTTFINRVRKLFSENEFELTHNSDHFLLGYRGGLYEIQDDYSVINPAPWGHAIGSGEAASRGSLYTTRDDWDSQYRIVVALEAAEAIVPDVRSPFVVLSI